MSVFIGKIVFCFIPAVAASFALSDAGIALGQRTPASTYAFIRSFGARINLDYSIDAESFATELVFDYKDYCKRRQPSVPLEDEVSFAWSMLR